MSSGNIVEIIGAVVDVQFAADAVPNIYDALLVTSADLTMEVQAQLGDGIVRTIAMGATEGLKRGLEVSNTGGPIAVPVGPGTLQPASSASAESWPRFQVRCTRCLGPLSGSRRWGP